MLFHKIIPSLLFILSCVLIISNSTYSHCLDLGSISISSESFSPSQGQTVCLSFTLDEPANVTIDVFDPDFRLVKRVLENQAVPQGEQKVCWDGTYCLCKYLISCFSVKNPNKVPLVCCYCNSCLCRLFFLHCLYRR